MDLEEAKQKIEISEDEKNAVGNYISTFHASINTLVGFNMLDYFAAQRRGWSLPGDFRDKRAPEEIGAEVLDWMDRAALVYSAMIKSAQRTTAPQALWRGTSVKEIEAASRRGAYGRLLSTTTTEDIAKNFTVPTDGDALLRIYRPPEIPFIDVSEFIDEEDYINQREKEYILSPFTKISSCTMRSDWNGYKYYDVGLQKPEMRAFEEGEKDTLREEIRTGFTDMLKVGREFVEVMDKLELIHDKFSSTTSLEDRQWLREERDRMEQKYSELRSQVEGFEIKMEHYAQGLFAEREREIGQAYEIVRAEEARIRQEEAEAKERETLARENEAIRINSSKLSGIENTPTMFYSTYENLKSEESRYRGISEKLGIPFNMQLPIKSISDNLQEMEVHVRNIRGRVDELSGQTFETSSDATKFSIEIQQYLDVYNNAQAQREPLYRITEEYSDEALGEAKRGIDEKIQEMIKRTRLQVIAMKKKEVEERRISFWGRLRGLDKLQEAELRNLGIEEQIVKKTPILPKAEYSVHDSLAELRAFSKRDLDGLATSEMIQFDSAVRKCFGVDDSEISRRADMKLRNSLPVVIEQPKRRMSTAKKIARANERTQRLQVELADVQNNSPRNSNMYAPQPTSYAVKSFTEILNRVVRDTVTIPEREAMMMQGTRTKGNMEDTLELWGNASAKRPASTYHEFDGK